MIIGRDKIAALIPHAGAMCLLDGVLGWDDASVRCVSSRYADADNPLRRADGTLGVACGIEIAAQAMAVHGRLLAGAAEKPGLGYLMSVRDVRFGAPLLDGEGDLLVEATLLMGDGGEAMYQFALRRDGVELLSGRAAVLLVPA
jgi:predicted hotdog family 3-hydroxylacyl-ACP dehydratase